MIIYDEPIDQYHANPAVSASKLRDFRLRGPAFYRMKYIDKLFADEDTEALRFGRAFDDLLANGAAEWTSRWVVRPPEIDYRTKEGKAWRAAHEGEQIIDHDDYVSMLRMLEAVHSHDLAMSLITDANSQVTIRGQLEAYGIQAQTRPDYLSFKPCVHTAGMPYTVDLKTTEDFSEWYDPYDHDGEHIGKPLLRWGYHRQAALAHWLCGDESEIRTSVHFLLVVEKRLPHRVGVIEIGHEWIACALREIELDLARLVECHRTGAWPSSPPDIIKPVVPTWYTRRDERVAFWHA